MIPLLGPLIKTATSGLDKLFTSDDERLKSKVASEVQLVKATEADTKLRMKELDAKGLKGLWRPLAATSIFLTLFLHWFIYPALMIVVATFNLDIYLPQLPELPMEFYGLAIAFISIYAHGRSLEKRL